MASSNSQSPDLKHGSTLSNHREVISSEIENHKTLVYTKWHPRTTYQAHVIFTFDNGPN